MKHFIATAVMASSLLFGSNALAASSSAAQKESSPEQSGGTFKYSTDSMKWSTKTGHRVRVFSSIDFPIRLVVTHHYIRAVLVRCNI
ncbi:hypothetical protein NVM76_10065, partial [Escherichia coli]|nr:hypothetical protein [Escherichia coli]